MKKVIIGAALAAVGVAALGVLRRFGPAIRERAMNKCHQMMSKCGEMFSQQASSRAGTARTGATTSGSGQTGAEEHAPGEATAAS